MTALPFRPPLFLGPRSRPVCTPETAPVPWSGRRTAGWLAGLLLLGGCAVQRPPAQVDTPTPAAWQAPLPHAGSLQQLSQWWQAWEDPVLVELLEQAQANSPTLAQATSRLAQARATQVSARAARLPSVDAQAQASRGFNEQVGALASTAQGGLQASWELDLFGGAAAREEAAQARYEGLQARWHEARVSVAAEVAQQYSQWHTCQQQLAVATADAQSRAATARLTRDSEAAGFTAPATAALATASAADAVSRREQQRLQCDLNLQALVVLTGMPQTPLHQRLAQAPSWNPPLSLFQVPLLPARLLVQRPDVHAAEREVAAASADMGSARAQQYPRLTLSGMIGRGWVSTGGQSVSSNLWSIGPVALHMPVWDAGRRAADIDAAQARYDEAVQLFHAQARKAVSEVEQALLQLDNTRVRHAQVTEAAEGYRRALAATQARWEAGMASLMELEDARRTALTADTARITLTQERTLAWIALYRAAGGGWQPHDPAPAPLAHRQP